MGHCPEREWLHWKCPVQTDRTDRQPGEPALCARRLHAVGARRVRCVHWFRLLHTDSRAAPLHPPEDPCAPTCETHRTAFALWNPSETLPWDTCPALPFVLFLPCFGRSLLFILFLFFIHKLYNKIDVSKILKTQFGCFCFLFLFCFVFKREASGQGRSPAAILSKAWTAVAPSTAHWIYSLALSQGRWGLTCLKPMQMGTCVP